MNYSFNATRAVLYICITAVVLMWLKSCGTQVTEGEIKAVAEACAKVGKRPSIDISKSGIQMRCET